MATTWTRYQRGHARSLIHRRPQEWRATETKKGIPGFGRKSTVGSQLAECIIVQTMILHVVSKLVDLLVKFSKGHSCLHDHASWRSRPWSSSDHVIYFTAALWFRQIMTPSCVRFRSSSLARSEVHWLSLTRRSRRDSPTCPCPTLASNQIILCNH